MTKYSNKIGNIPDDWDFINANDCLIIESGMRPKEYVTDIDTHIPSLGGENIDDSGCLVFDNIRYIDPSYYKKMKKGHIKDDDIYINKDGANTGKVAFSKTKPFKECAVNEHVFLIRNDGTFKQQYLFYCLLSNLGKQQILKKIIGSAQEGINNSFTKGIILPKPSLPEQASIANILSKVDEAIESVKKSIAAAEKLKKSLMQNLLTGRIKPDGTLRTEEEFYEDEKFGKVPIGWDVKKVKEIFYINRLSLSNKTDDNYKFKYITIENVSTEHIDFANCQEFLFKNSPGRARRYIISNDILISGVRPNLKAFAIYQRPDSNEWICSTGFHVLTAKDKVSPQFFYYQILSSIGESQFYSFVAGSNYPAIGDSDMKRMLLLVPPYDEQKTISKKIEDISIYQKQKKEKIGTLERLKKSLMQNLLTGKVRVGEGKYQNRRV